MDEKGRRIGYLVFWCLYAPLVLLAGGGAGLGALLALLVLLPMLPAFMVSGVESLFEPEQEDPSLVLLHATRRKPTRLFGAAAFACVASFVAALLGGPLDPQMFALFPWSLRFALLAVALYLLSPTVSVTRTVLRREGALLHYQSRHHPLLSTRYRQPATLDLSAVARVRLSLFEARGESGLQLVVEGADGGSTTLWIDPALQGQVERFLDAAQAHFPHWQVARELPPACELPPTVRRRIRARQEAERKNRLEA